MTKQKLSCKKAKKLSIIKWQWIVDHNGLCHSDEIRKELPELTKLHCLCGFCERWKINIDGWIDTNCSKCELAIAGNNCHHADSLFAKWADCRYSKTYAEQLLELMNYHDTKDVAVS